MKQLLKYAIHLLIKTIPFLRRRSEWGYGLVQWRILMVNFLFQRIFRLNSQAKWSVHFTSCVLSPQNILIGRNVGKSFAVSGGCYIQAFNGIEIGDGTIFSFGVAIVSSNHDPSNLSEAVSDAPVRIGRNCWLGKNATVLPGVELGDGCVVGAGAVVTRSFGAGKVLAGVPAREIASAQIDIV